ncbi:MAG: hypothetical protein R2784_14240 [Saprospiraceae bacterium]
MDDDQFGGAVPAFANLRIQRNSLQSFDFGYGQDGLFSLKGSAAVENFAWTMMFLVPYCYRAPEGKIS